ncbi:Hypothetical_protein [Hexamita inflata]|uniref:Hypothetical_protein n=1 Tax=Hexamita inflata TaxID=28002 RepID=A0AA86PX20_9EUKA|nr:Hypothetical protein HINF_LOCUS30247 [Hexamita inflata]
MAGGRFQEIWHFKPGKLPEGNEQIYKTWLIARQICIYKIYSAPRPQFQYSFQCINYSEILVPLRLSTNLFINRCYFHLYISGAIISVQKEEGWVWVFLDTSNGYAGVHGSCQTPSASPTGPGDPRRPGARRPSKDRYPRGAPRSFPPCSETKYRGGKSNKKGM